MGTAEGSRREAGWEHFVEHVLTAPGRLPASVRRAIFGSARASNGGGDIKSADVPASLASFTDAVANRSYQVTDDQVTEQREAGHCDNQVFEAVVAAAVGAASVRREAAHRAMNEAGYAPRRP